jgi:hypothetical protein
MGTNIHGHWKWNRQPVRLKISQTEVGYKRIALAVNTASATAITTTGPTYFMMFSIFAL